MPGEVVTGTLCRLIELTGARIASHPQKYRVEHGDNGAVLGTVMRMLGCPETPWEAWYFDTDEHQFQDEHVRLLGRFETPEAAALRMAAERFVPAVVEEVSTYDAAGHAAMYGGIGRWRSRP